MQSAPQAPAAPDPYRTTAAQTQGDIQSAIANAVMGNANVTTPFGSVTNSQSGTYTITDAMGNKIDHPSRSNVILRRLDRNPRRSVRDKRILKQRLDRFWLPPSERRERRRCPNLVARVVVVDDPADQPVAMHDTKSPIVDELTFHVSNRSSDKIRDINVEAEQNISDADQNGPPTSNRIVV